MEDNSEFSEEKSSGRPDFERYLNVARRRSVHFLIPLFLGWIVVWGASWVLPTKYKSTTLILVEQPTVPSNYVQPNVSEDLQDRLQSITQQILSRTRLLSIIDKLQLYGGGASDPDGKVESMRKDIDIQLVRSENGRQISGFTVGFSARDGRTAQLAAAELTDLFIGENLRARQQASENTTQFITSQLEGARATLAEQEAKVRDYQAKHQGELPSQQAGNIQILSGLQSQLQNEQDALNSVKQQGIYLQALIEQYRALGATATTPDGSPTSLPAIDQRLDTLRANLATLSTHYTSNYPDIQELKSEIASTEKTRDELLAALKAKSKSAKQGDEGSAAPLRGDGNSLSPMMQIESQIKLNHAEVENREKAIVSLKERVDQYQARLNAEPSREQELAELTRGYDQSKVNYDDLLKKKNESSMATSMEMMQQGERFTVLDPPSMPTKPDFPNRLKFCGIGLGAGIALGLLVVAAFELMDDRIFSEREIAKLLPVSILSEIPEVVIPSDERRTRRQMVVSWTLAALVFAAILAGSAFSFLRE